MSDDKTNPYAASNSGTSIQLSQLIRSDEGVGVDFELVPSDLEAFFKFHYLKKPDFRKAYLKRWLLLGTTFAVMIGLLFTLGGFNRDIGRIAGAIVIPLGLIYTLFFPLVYRWRVKRLATIVLKSGQNLGMSGCQRLRFVEKGVLQNNPAGEFLHYWICIEAIERTATHAFIYVSGLSAIILPARVFEQKSEFDEMLAYADEKIETRFS